MFSCMMWQLCILLLCYVTMTSAEMEVGLSQSDGGNGNSSGLNTQYIVMLKPLTDLPDNYDPVVMLHERASQISANVPGSKVIHMYDNIAKYLRLLIFSFELEKFEDLAIVGELYGKSMKSIEAVSYFYAAELVTDVRNLAHGLPYRQVLNRPFRDLQDISGERVDLQDIACTIESQNLKNLTAPVDIGVTMDTMKNFRDNIKEGEEHTDKDDIQIAEAPVTVFVMDTGIQGSHSWFKQGQVTSGFDFESVLDRESRNGTENNDPNGHGTQIAGIIGGTFPSENDVLQKSERSRSHLVSVRVLDDTGKGKSDDIIAGLDFIIGAYFTMKSENPRTVNIPQSHLSAIVHMSFSGRSSGMLKIILNAVSKVMPVVGASGDDDSFSCWTTPADCKSTISVGASMSVSNLPISGSNFGECISMFAPGEDIVAPYIGDSDHEMKAITGSSASAAFVTSILVNIYTIIDTSRRLHESFHRQIAEIDVSIFMKAVLTEAGAVANSRSFNAHSEVHKNGYISCAVDCHNTIRTKMEERLKNTVSKGFDEVVQYDEDAPRVDSPTKKLRDRFKQMKKMNQHSVDLNLSLTK